MVKLAQSVGFDLPFRLNALQSRCHKEAWRTSLSQVRVCVSAWEAYWAPPGVTGPCQGNAAPLVKQLKTFVLEHR